MFHDCESVRIFTPTGGLYDTVDRELVACDRYWLDDDKLVLYRGADEIASYDLGRIVGFAVH